MKSVKEFFEGKAGKLIAVVGSILLVTGGYFAVRGAVGPSDAEALSLQRMLVDTTTGKAFAHSLVVGEKYPIMAPSGQVTGYPAEECYWTEDGHVKETPDYVVLNADLGKPGYTFCPVCHRLVVHNNPPAGEGVRVPPKQIELLGPSRAK